MNWWQTHRPLLKSVSRSFYLSIRWLPEEMREPVALGYLMARLTDTLTDCPQMPTQARSSALEAVRDRMEGRTTAIDLSSFTSAVVHPGENHLLLRAEELFAWFEGVDHRIQLLLIQVWTEIIKGQQWDLEFFSKISGNRCTEEDLLLYTYRVAGCVGEFWTDLAYLQMGETFAETVQQDSMREWGRSLGQGLQLINIIRDLHEDLPAGRYYLGTPQPSQTLVEHWLKICRSKLEQGHLYIAVIRNRRVRMATALPLHLALATADQLEKTGFPKFLHQKVKVSRCQVWRAFAKELCRSVL